MSQTKSRARNTLDQFGVTVLNTPHGEYQFVSHLLFFNKTDMKRTSKDSVSLCQRIDESFDEACVLYCKAVIGKRISRHYKRHMLDTIRLANDLNAMGAK